MRTESRIYLRCSNRWWRRLPVCNTCRYIATIPVSEGSRLVHTTQRPDGTGGGTRAIAATALYLYSLPGWNVAHSMHQKTVIHTSSQSRGLGRRLWSMSAILLLLDRSTCILCITAGSRWAAESLLSVCSGVGRPHRVDVSAEQYTNCTHPVH